MNPCLDLKDYRYQIRLDEPFLAPDPAPAAGREALVDEVLGHLLSEKPGAWGLEDGSPPAFAANHRFLPVEECGGSPNLWRTTTEASAGYALPQLPQGLGRGAPQGTYESKRRKVRALLTVRPPDPLPSWFHATMDRLLQRESHERGTVEALELPRVVKAVPGATYTMADRCALWRGDITALRVDAVVNAANSALLGCFQPFHACIDNAIHSAAGPRVREDCHAIMQRQGAPEETGRAKITLAYNLPARYILHTVGPIFHGEGNRVFQEQELQLSACYRSCLELALRVPGIRSVAFCCISTGVFGFPSEPAGRVALRSVEDFLEGHPDVLDLIVFNVFSADDFQIYKRLLCGQ